MPANEFVSDMENATKKLLTNYNGFGGDILIKYGKQVLSMGMFQNIMKHCFILRIWSG